MNKKKTILITGAGSGIGRDAAYALARRGHTVIATTHTDEQAERLTKEVNVLGIRLTIFRLDITNELDRQKVTEYDIDVLVNNAGIGESGPLAEIPLERVRANFETNVFGTLALTQAVLKPMMTKKYGTVITVSSVAGRIPTPFLAPYSMTKYALSGGMAAMRQEMHDMAPDIHITLIEPGAYATGFNQRMFATKYQWLDATSFFWKRILFFKQRDMRFKHIEMKTTDSIVARIVRAAQSHRPRLRYSAPWYQSVYVHVLRIFGS